jgi:hypothetical protein
MKANITINFTNIRDTPYMNVVKVTGYTKSGITRNKLEQWAKEGRLELGSRFAVAFLDKKPGYKGKKARSYIKQLITVSSPVVVKERYCQESLCYSCFHEAQKGDDYDECPVLGTDISTHNDEGNVFLCAMYLNDDWIDGG